MLHETPLRLHHEEFARTLAAAPDESGAAANRPGAAVGRQVHSALQYIPFGVADDRGGATCELVATYGPVESEYAAIRRGAGLLDSPHRGTIHVAGKDRRDLLNRMLTQELKDLAPGMVRPAFWLNRKGRIEADLLVIET